MASQDYIKVKHVRTWLLRSSLAKFWQFHSECCFSILLQFIFFCLRSPCSVVAFVVLWFPCFLLLAKIRKFLIFFWSEMFKWFLGESHVFGRSSFFVLFVGNYGALNLRLPVLALSESVTMSGTARTLLHLNMSRLHFLVLVLQVSNSFDLNSLFLHVLFSLILTVYGGHVQLIAESLCSTNFLLEVEYRFFVFLFPASTGFPLKTHVFGKSFLLHFYCVDDTLILLK